MLKPVPVFRVAMPALAVFLAACAGPQPAEPAAGGNGGTGGGLAGMAASVGGSSSGQSGSTARGGQGGAGQGGAGSPGSAGRVGGSGGMSTAGTGGSAGAPSGGAGSSAVGGTGGGSGTGGSSGTGGGSGAGGTGALPPLHVDGVRIADPSGKKIVLRGFDLPDLGTLYSGGGQNASGITARIDKALASGLAGHVVRLAVYPRTTFNSGSPFYSPVPYPVGPMAPSGMHQALSEADYVSKLLRPAVDYAKQKGMYAIIDYHQIDDASGQSGTDAVTFWNTVAPLFASDDNVIFEPFNEPIDTSTTWSTFKTTVQTFIDAIRAAAPNNLIVVPSMNWDQRPGDAASSPPLGTNLVYTAHVYPGNWSTSFQQQVATAVAVAPVFFTEWGFVQDGSDKNLGTSDANWGPSFQATVDANGASWSAWVADGSWTPNLFTNQMLSALSPFGTFTAGWLTSKASSDWVQ